MHIIGCFERCNLKEKLILAYIIQEKLDCAVVSDVKL